MKVLLVVYLLFLLTRIGADTLSVKTLQDNYPHQYASTNLTEELDAGTIFIKKYAELGFEIRYLKKAYAANFLGSGQIRRG